MKVFFITCCCCNWTRRTSILLKSRLDAFKLAPTRLNHYVLLPGFRELARSQIYFSYTILYIILFRFTISEISFNYINYCAFIFLCFFNVNPHRSQCDWRPQLGDFVILSQEVENAKFQCNALLNDNLLYYRYLMG